ncbi:MAG: cytochrome c oxidase subunit 3 family protein [Candidatus Marinamargulisbacteria bacterium]
MDKPLQKRPLPHYFKNEHQEFEACKLGMWAFMVQEILFFSGLFVAYGVYKVINPEMFLYASSLLDWKLGFINTLFLILSSFTMVMSVYYIQHGEKKKTLVNLTATFFLATLFLVIKGFEYKAKFDHGYYPGMNFTGEGPFDTLHIFFGLYFTITGLHAIHVLIGMALILWLIYRVAKNNVNKDYFTPLEMVGLYWHLVDVVWIFLFPLLYLL